MHYTVVYCIMEMLTGKINVYMNLEALIKQVK